MLDIWNNEVGKLITEDFSPVENGENFVHACRYAKLAVEMCSFVLTMLAGLESEIPDLGTRDRLIIHIVGASDQEFHSKVVFEELLHHLPKLRNLVMGFIGPNIGFHGKVETDTSKMWCCSKCQLADRPFWEYFIWDGLYHDFLRSPLSAQYKPDMIFAFHSHHHQAETNKWGPTLERIIDLDTPAVFTAYTRTDAVGGEMFLDAMGAYISKSLDINPWKGVISHGNTFNERYMQSYMNGYWFIAKGRKPAWERVSPATTIYELDGTEVTTRDSPTVEQMVS